MTRRIARETSTIEAASAADSATALLDAPATADGAKSSPASPKSRPQRPHPPAANGHHFAATSHEEHGSNRQAELFYLQKQIQLQIQMVFILEDGAHIKGVVEWYDRNSIKVRGKSRVLIYKTAIKYLYKAGEVGSAPEE